MTSTLPIPLERPRRPCPHVCHVYPSFGTGGTEVRTAHVIAASGDRARYSIVALDGNLSGRARIADDRVAYHDASHDRSIRALSRQLKAIGPDLVVTYGWGGTDAIVAARWARCPVVHAEDGFLPDETFRQIPRRLYARRVLLRMAQRVVCASMTLKRMALDLWWLPRAKVLHLPNGIDPNLFHPPTPREAAEARGSLGIGEAEFVVGTVGRLGPEKNFARLIHAFAALASSRPSRLLIVGDGPCRAELERLVDDFGLGRRVRFLGQSDRPAVIYRALDLFALSSDTEQMPIVVLEAMGTGLPVLSTDVGDVSEMVVSANRRYVIPPTREGEYTRRLIELSERPDLRASMGAENRERCLERYTLDALVGAYLGLFDEVIAESSRCR